jgi:hypothetical protein
MAAMLAAALAAVKKRAREIEGKDRGWKEIARIIGR